MPYNILKIMTICILFLAFIRCSKNETEMTPIEPITEYLNILSSNKDFSGVLLIGNENGLVSKTIIGNRNKEVKHTFGSQFNIASLTKTFTSASILMLKKEGKLKLEDKVGKYIPSFKYGDQITILNLLRHESGLSEVLPEELKNETLSSNELIQRIGDKPLMFEPGSNGRYSNSGYTVLARIVEIISDQTFHSFLKDHFYNNLNINKTGDLFYEKIPSKFSTRYFPTRSPDYVKEIKDVTNNTSLGSGSIYSTAEDLIKWGYSIMNKEKIDIFAENYPYGWGRDSIAGLYCLNQTGLYDGHVSSLLLFPETKTVLVLLSNIQNEMWTIWGKDISKLYFKGPESISFPKKRKELYPPMILQELVELTGRYELNKDRYVDIKHGTYDLYLHLNGHHEAHHLFAVDHMSFDLRSFTGNVSFWNDTLYWKGPEAWGGNIDKYVKVK